MKGLFAVFAVASAKVEFVEKFEEFLKATSKKYHSGEQMLHRMKIFIDNLERIEEANKADTAKHTHLSPYADWTPAEFTARNTLKFHPMLKAAKKLETLEIPASLDWRTSGAVNKVKDQGQCGSCWSFGTVANIEGARVVQTGATLLSLSEQQLVDCSNTDYGCNGGLPSNAYGDMIKGKWGLELEKAYPYEAVQGTCEMETEKEKVYLESWESVDQDEDQIAAALYKYGPLAIGINAGPMQWYTGGIADPKDCDPSGIDHAVNIIGYGEEDGTKYWIIRNSWGTSWGEDGYYRIVRGVGKCGLNQMVTTATWKSADVMV